MCSTRATLAEVAEEITQRELRNQSGEIMRGLDAGKTFIVTRNGVAVGELRPIRRRRFVHTATLLEHFKGAPKMSYEDLRRDMDAVIDPYDWRRPR
jgi:antitoxin (DNA-binding transcriptional repressor) of toxin-antitoxin stability system